MTPKVKQKGKGSTEKRCKPVVGKLKRFSPGIRRLFEQAVDETSREESGVFHEFVPQHNLAEKVQSGTDSTQTKAGPLKPTSQTYPLWKVNMSFIKLDFRQRKRLKQNTIYLLPIGPFPNNVLFSEESLGVSMFELLCKFASVYFYGMKVKLLGSVNVDELNCRTRIHTKTGKKQILVGDLFQYLKKRRPSDGYCMVGLSWIDLYPSADWNFVLGEGSCSDGCAVFSVGHYEPLSFVQKIQNTEGSVSLDEDKHDNGQNSPAGSLTQHSASSSSENVSSRETESSNGTVETEITEKLLWKLCRVMTHEIAHIFGLQHCTFFSCAMNESTSVKEAEEQPMFMCPVCLRKLQKALKFDIISRYRTLLKCCSFLSEVFKRQRIAREVSASDNITGITNTETVHESIIPPETIEERGDDDVFVSADDNSDIESLPDLGKFEVATTWLGKVLLFIKERDSPLIN